MTTPLEAMERARRELEDGVDLSAVLAKVCSRCGQYKAASEFPRSSAARSKLSSWCRPCHRQAVRDWRARNRERENASRRLPPLREPRVCLVCGLPFTAPRRRGPAPAVCSPACRRERKARLGRERRDA